MFLFINNDITGKAPENLNAPFDQTWAFLLEWLAIIF